MKKIFIIILVLFANTSYVYPQTVEAVLDKIRENYQPERSNVDSVKITMSYHYPERFNTIVTDSSTKSDFVKSVFTDTVYSKNIGGIFRTYFVKESFLPETFGDELNVWFDYLPDPVSGEFYGDYAYNLLYEVSKVKGTEEFHGQNYLAIDINVNKLGYILKLRDLFNRNFYKSITIYLDNRTYLIAGYSFEMIFNPNSSINAKHDIVLSDYRKINDVLIPTKIKRYNIDFIKSAVPPDVRDQFYQKIDDNIDLIYELKQKCDTLNENMQNICTKYYKDVLIDYMSMKQMTNDDIFELEYEIINVEKLK